MCRNIALDTSELGVYEITFLIIAKGGSELKTVISLQVVCPDNVTISVPSPIILNFYISPGGLETFQLAELKTSNNKCPITGYLLVSKFPEISQNDCKEQANTEGCRTIVIDTSKAGKYVVKYNVTATGGASVVPELVIVNVRKPPTLCSEIIEFKISSDRQIRVS